MAEERAGREYTVIDRQRLVADRRNYWRVKRFQDVVLATLALALLVIPMSIVALLIWVDDPHASPIFVQERVGRDGELFRFYKVRSMYSDAENKLEELLMHNEMDGPAFKMKDDPRITRIGRFIRKTSIDELPQLINVIKGDMSLVGPRPALPREVVQYSDYAKQRLYVQPGLTCYWQIQPQRNDIGFDDWIDLDIRYIQERSFIVDWKIMLKTFSVILTAQGI